MPWGYDCAWLLRADSQPGPAPNDCNGNGVPDECDLCGDLDGDLDVDYDDYVIFLDAFGGEADGNPPEDWCCDYDDTGAVGMMDYAAWLACYRDYIGKPGAPPPGGNPPGVVRPVEQVRESGPALNGSAPPRPASGKPTP